MTTTRWKMTAGGLVLALGGLAAVAGVPARSCQVDHKAGPAVLVEVPIAPVTYQTPVTRTAHQPGTEAVAPIVAATPEPPQIPAVSTPAEATVIPLPDVAIDKKPEPAPKAEPKPAPKEAKVFELKIPAADVAPPVIPAPEPTKPVAAAPKLPEPTPTPAPAPLLPDPKPEVKPVPAPTPAPAPEVKPVASTPDPLLNTKPDPAPAHFAGEKKLKILLQMGDDRPRFEVRDGEEVYLKVICDKVDVKSPSDRGETMSTLRATGHVTFVTPGGDGTCEELTVIPGTGQVVVTGHVSFKYNWGKVETTVSGEKMTFRLGSTPGVPVETVSRVR